MAAMAVMAAAPSRARTRPRWTAPLPMQPGMLPRTLWQPAWQTSARSELAYAIGVAHPVSINVNTFGTGKVEDEVLAKAVEKVFDLRPEAIIHMLDLRRPIYRQLAAYGHFGREELGVAWEKTDRTDALLKAVEELR